MLEGLIVFDLKRFEDERGFFYESYNQSNLRSQLDEVSFMQDNVAYTDKKFTFRGLHQQLGSFGQGKLISVISGSILDIVVDIRPESKTFGEAYQITLTDKNNLQLFVPEGFLHGYLTLSDKTLIIYKVTKEYSPENEIGVNIFDENLKIKLPCSKDEVILSQKDQNLKPLEELKKKILNK